MEGFNENSSGPVVVLDIGSSSVRVAAFTRGPDDVGKPVLIEGSLAAMPCALNGAGEGDPFETRRCLELCMDLCMEGLRQSYQHTGEAALYPRVASVCCASYAMSWLGVNSTTGHPCTPVYTYARADPSAPTAVEALRATLASADEHALKRLYAETGVPIHSAYAPALIYQLISLPTRSDYPNVHENDNNASDACAENSSITSRSSSSSSSSSSCHATGNLATSGVAENTVWQTIGAWVLAQWCGLISSPLSTSEASWTGLLNVHKCEWHSELATTLGLVLPSPDSFAPSDTPPSAAKTTTATTTTTGAYTAILEAVHKTTALYAGHLPPVVDYASSNLGLTLAPAWAARWPELAHARWLLPLGDGACANIGTGCVDATQLACTVGTSAAVRIVLPAPPPLPLGPPLGLWCYRIDNKRVLLGGAVTDGGAYVSWLRSLLGLEGDNEFARVLAEAATAEGHGVSLLPFLGPERSIGWHSTATSCIAGLTRCTTRAQVLRAALDGVALRLAAIVNLLEPFLDEHNEVKNCDSSDERGATSGAASLSDVIGGKSEEAQRSYPKQAAPLTSPSSQPYSSSSSLPSSSFSRPNSAALWASGGALTNNPLWRQIVADATNRPVVGSKGSGIETLTGCALLAYEALAANNENDYSTNGNDVEHDGKKDNVDDIGNGKAVELYSLNIVKPATSILETTTTTTRTMTAISAFASHDGTTSLGSIEASKTTIKTELDVVGNVSNSNSHVAWPRSLGTAPTGGPPSYTAMAAAQNELYESVLGPTSDFKRWYGDERESSTES